jgi:hypothetical protein
MFEADIKTEWKLEEIEEKPLKPKTKITSKTNKTVKQAVVDIYPMSLRKGSFVNLQAHS